MKHPLCLLCLLWLCACGPDPIDFPTCDGTAGSASVADPTWTDGVGVLIGERCAGCHVEGGIAPFALTTYDETVAYADGIRTWTGQRLMPPPGPTSCGECQSFHNARWLTNAEISMLDAWVGDGAPLGDGPEPPPPPALETLARVDRTVDIGADYLPDADLEDDYRCFLVDPEVSQDRFLIGHHIRPGDARVVHHVVLYGLHDDSALAGAREKDAAGGHGWSCYGGANVGGNAPVIAGWAPGVGATVFPEGTGIRLLANQPLVLQVHYNLENGTHPDRTEVDLMLSEEEVEEAFVLDVNHTNFALQPGEEEVESKHQRSRVLDGPGTPVFLWGVLPHMHTLGRTIHAESWNAQQRTCLFDIPVWDFEWQSFYFYEDPVEVHSSDNLRLTCTWSTRGVDEIVPFGDGTRDEMCLAFFYATVARP